MAKRCCSNCIYCVTPKPVEGIEGPTSGPGRLCKAMGIDRRLDGHDLTGDGFFIAEGPGASPYDGARFRIARRPRIGVDYAGPRWAGRLLRFYIRGNPFVSRS